MPNIIEVDLCFKNTRRETKIIANYRQELQSMRVGRANQDILDRVWLIIMEHWLYKSNKITLQYQKLEY